VAGWLVEVALRVVFLLTIIVFATALNVTGVLALSVATTLNVYDPALGNSNELKVMIFGSAEPTGKVTV